MKTSTRALSRLREMERRGLPKQRVTVLNEKPSGDKHQGDKRAKLHEIITAEDECKKKKEYLEAAESSHARG